MQLYVAAPLLCVYMIIHIHWACVCQVPVSVPVRSVLTDAVFSLQQH